MPQTAEPAPPPFNVRLHNARLAAGRVLTRAMHGGHFGVSSIETDRRLKVCDTCARLRHSDWVCTNPACGCFVKVKARLATEQCPENRWVVLAAERPSSPILLSGERLLDKELELRAIVPTDHFISQTFNRFREEELKGGCHSCRRKAYGRTLAAAMLEFLRSADAATVNRVRVLFPDTTHLEGALTSTPWSAVGKGSGAGS